MLPASERDCAAVRRNLTHTSRVISEILAVTDIRNSYVSRWRCHVARSDGHPAQRQVAHRTATGPDSVVIHAVRAGRPSPSAPAAVCGYPLRVPHKEVRLDDLTFEDRWLLTDDCCAECGAVLKLKNPGPHTAATKREHNWALIAAVTTLVPMVSALLFRVLTAARN
jgi:hypothetical protein